MRSDEIRQKYLDFFKTKDHLVLPSASLIPENDPTLLLIGAGMAPFKPYFTGQAKPPHPRIATAQKCMRTPDIERVGKTARHCTFFEMLGNFSFGDYFKSEAIAWAWEFITQWLHLPAEKLWATVYEDDDEAFAIWRDNIGIPAEKIVRLGKEDNFWEIGTGPCGPCSEIYFDRGPEAGCGRPDCKPGCDCDRYLEFWNLVFTQFNRDEAGNYTQLEKKNIDTGMGLERIAAIMQNVPNVFEIDTIRPVLDLVASCVGQQYGGDSTADVAIRVITEHARGVTFMIGDGILPSNEGRGYVLRRLLRRAVRYGKLVGLDKPFLQRVAEKVIEINRAAYPELAENQGRIIGIIAREEERFQATLDQGTEILDGIIAGIKEQGGTTLSGDDVFRLYDTFGFPRELTEEIAAEQGLNIDVESFNRAMHEQRERARAARQDTNSIYQLREVYTGLDPKAGASFVGYDHCEEETMIVAIVKDNELVDAVGSGENAEILLRETPFYAESGGQVSDRGELRQGSGRAEVVDVKKLLDGRIVHMVRGREGNITAGDVVTVNVDRARRLAVARNHTATHLLHHALRQYVGEHVQQAGSLVAPDVLRFDISHYEPLTPAELAAVEEAVNAVVLANLPVTVSEMSPEKAKDLGAIALFAEKYGSVVRVVSIGDFSRELCGGTHVTATGEIGLFKITGESSVGAGLRRIEAITGQRVLEYINGKTEIIKTLSQLLKTPETELVQRVSDLTGELRKTEKKLAQAQGKMLQVEVERLLHRKEAIDGIVLVTGEVSVPDMEALRQAADFVRDRLDKGVIVLGTAAAGKVNFVAMVAKELTGRGLHAGNLVREIARMTGGGGGGRPEMALAGGRDPAKLAAALAAVPELVRKQLTGGK
ncbi:MAG: alanine--tRNA ligase [bacterium]|jgi:alanyl-tRNA synthetase